MAATYAAITVPTRQVTSVDTAARAWFLIFDSVLAEECTLSATVTRNPIAGSASIADHMYDEPGELVLTAVVSDTPDWESLAEMQAGQTPSDLYYSKNISRSASALAALVEFKERHELCNIQTGLRLLKNYVLERLSYTTDNKSAHVLSFSATFREVRLASALVVLYAPKPKKKASPMVVKGTVVAKEPSDEEIKTRAKTAAYELLGIGNG